MRVPNMNAGAVHIPTDQSGLRHTIRLDAPMQAQAGSQAFTSRAENTANILDGLSSVANAFAPMVHEKIKKNIALQKTMKEERAANEAREAQVKLNTDTENLLYGNDEVGVQGLYSLQGKDTYDLVTHSRKSIEKLTETISKSLSSGAQKIFNSTATDMRMAVLPGIARHEAKERVLYEEKTWTDLAGIERGNALNNFSDPLRYNQFIERQQEAEWNRTERSNLPDDKRQQAVHEKTGETLGAIFERQVEAKDYENARLLFTDERISEESKVMLAENYRRAQRNDALAIAKEHPENVHTQIAALQQDEKNPLAFTASDITAIANQADASLRRGKAEKIKRMDHITKSSDQEFAMAIKTGDFSRILAMEEELLTLDKGWENEVTITADNAENMAESTKSAKNKKGTTKSATPETQIGPAQAAKKSRQMRALNATVLPLLEAAKGMPFHDREASLQTAFLQARETFGEEGTAKLEGAYRTNLEKEKTTALKDPATYVSTMGKPKVKP